MFHFIKNIFVKYHIKYPYAKYFTTSKDFVKFYIK